MTPSFTDNTSFLSAFPMAVRYDKGNDPQMPFISLLPVIALKVRTPWGPIVCEACGRQELIDSDVNPDTHVLLVNTAVGECYPCQVAPNGAPVGYSRANVQLFCNDGDLNCVCWVGEPVLAIQVDQDTPFTSFEGHEICPAGCWLVFSESKGVYFNTEAKFRANGYTLG